MSSSFRFLILTTDYSEFLHWLYFKHPGLEKEPYEKQMCVRNESLFGVADFYSNNLRRLGHEANDIHANTESMQKAWAREHGFHLDEPKPTLRRLYALWQRGSRIAAKTPIRYLGPILRPILPPMNGQPSWFYDILEAQIRYYKPDVLLNQDLRIITGRFLKEMKSYVRLLVGQIASPLPRDANFDCYDLVISSLPNFVDHFKQMGFPSELHRFAFEPRVLEGLPDPDKKIPVSFVGSLSRQHKERIHLLEYIGNNIDVAIWGHGLDGLRKTSAIERCYKGQAWGAQMYEILRNSKITINHHIDIAECFANNMRLYEATGCGTLLITDDKKNLNELFEVGKEVVVYRSADELVDLIQHYGKHDAEREQIAIAGQKRTLTEHTYYNRMAELAEIIRIYI